MIEYRYKKVKGYEQRKFIENGHTMFEFDVLQRLKRLAALEEQIKQGRLLPIKCVRNCPECGSPDLDKDEYYCRNCSEYYA